MDTMKLLKLTGLLMVTFIVLLFLARTVGTGIDSMVPGGASGMLENISKSSAVSAWNAIKP